MSSPSLDLTVQPSATAGAATIGSGTSIGIGGATVGGSEAPALGSTARGVGSNAPGATLDAGANPGLYGTLPVPMATANDGLWSRLEHVCRTARQRQLGDR